MNWITISKLGLRFITSTGVSAVISNIVKSTTPANATTVNILVARIGCVVLSSMIADQASSYVETEFDKLLNITKREEEKKI